MKHELLWCVCFISCDFIWCRLIDVCGFWTETESRDQISVSRNEQKVTHRGSYLVTIERKCGSLSGTCTCTVTFPWFCCNPQHSCCWRGFCADHESPWKSPHLSCNKPFHTGDGLGEHRTCSQKKDEQSNMSEIKAALKSEPALSRSLFLI